MCLVYPIALSGKSLLVDPRRRTCSCKPGIVQTEKCEHLYAADAATNDGYAIDEYDDLDALYSDYDDWLDERRSDDNGHIPVAGADDIVEARDASAPSKRKKTYPRNWSAYNKAQMFQGDLFPVLASRLSSIVHGRKHAKGRRPIAMNDVVFACIYKIYSNKPGRKFTSDLREAKRREYVHSAVSYNSISRHMRSPALTPILVDLVSASALPIKGIEKKFAIDSTGFSTSNFIRWFNKKYGKEMDNREWLKCHALCGVRTNIITDVEISGWSSHDTNYFIPLLDRTTQNFDVEEILADKAYLSRANMEFAASKGATPFIPFKSNTVKPPLDGSVWSEMYYRFIDDYAEWKSGYTLRNNVESAFSMMKKTQWYSLRSKDYWGR